ncbi:MAG TPA: phosphoribosylamine--glycine ligase [Pyrinomonadaceae bacterium]|jgi:phosphoribosylamine--glycine ligase|nr:phosphoribosylamine--glycine ligase [Pyrinomonadaceae bacterium]
MKILVIGGGGREHALVWALKKSRHNARIFCAPGNAGIAEMAECIGIKPYQIKELADFAETNGIELTVVGGETSLALGVVDEFEKRGLRVMGPSKKASRLESSKIFAKEFMSRHGIPTARFCTAASAEEAKKRLSEGEFGGPDSPVVVKADGLAAGKGVVVAKDRAEAENAIEELTGGVLVSKEAAEQILLEEMLIGKEVSLLLFADGKNYALMPPARDHKRIGEGDTGPNTGGMGVITDARLLSPEDLQKIVEEIIEPTLAGAEKEGSPFKGILFLGLMMTAEGPKVLEYNVRFGDPEAEAILVRLESDLVDVCDAIIDGTLDKMLLEWKDGCSAVVILAARGYPANPETGAVIGGLDIVKDHQSVIVLHAGTALNADGEVITAGGRVLAVTATASNLTGALHRCYKAVNEISWDGMYCRRDIGK